jgi:hypothetical protein
MEKTPMQELIEYLENNSLIDKKVLINRCKNLLEKEKQVIEDAFMSGILHEKNNQKVK